jgi:hypothetical protein
MLAHESEMIDQPDFAMKKVIVSLLIILSCSGLGHAQIASWTFETSMPAGAPGAGAWITNIASEVGSGTASGFHAGVATYSNPVGNGSANSFSANTWAVGDYFQFAVSTIGYTGIGVYFDQASSATGPGRFTLAYSIDGNSFTPVIAATDYTVHENAFPNSWNSTTASSLFSHAYDLSSVTELNNSFAVYFRLVNSSTISAGGGIVNPTAGTSRVDNFSVAVVPEPSTMALTALGGLLGLVAARRNQPRVK